ncbi:flagellar l-ring protein : Flagellar L-ring protein FlgH OS=uncultured planctomycete GN=HGMM_F33C03C02 PE=4 SV=1: FlgH [Gemmataceae bacterium]|jgi:flagellar L-ring protein precursor FlgH|nr:flagellar l-ring protein : Flagellar L-ring protein FlgH OS=uncultured planctomycete GN=HGMM_F33C03C02 PE=4 SV=1: FlgH [Gemmataceae bacterium]VTT97928.1 flagellar l-ring protein : Flagellar L-ring protein FlgH OS=uncultured planctomycete GN=HGMM_F33C03C02 PE=4 SV=1: FlgH [Gemmataceae bacterium]
MRPRYQWLVAALAAAGAAASVARADSIWERRDPRYANLFQDNRARQIGDVLTVVVSETTVANEQDQRTLNKTTSALAVLGFGPAASPGQLYSSNSNRQFSGSAQLTSNRVFTDRMAVTVVDMMPNGNLVVEGYRSRVVAGEERVLRVTGVIRQADVGVGNLVPSQSVANFRITYLGRGPESRSVNQNPPSRLGNLLWPW